MICEKSFFFYIMIIYVSHFYVRYILPHPLYVITPPPHNRGGGKGGEAFLVLWFPRILKSYGTVEDKLLRS